MCGEDVPSIRVLCSDKDGVRSAGLEGLHKLPTQDPALGLAVLRGLKDCEHRRMCSEFWSPARPYKPSQWEHLPEVECLGCEEGRIWRAMGGEEAKEVK